MGWIRWTGKTLEFVGKLAQTESFEKWAESQGEKVITDIGLKTGGYIFGLGRNQKAKNLIWGELQSIAKTNPELSSAIQYFAADYPKLLESLQSYRFPHCHVYLFVIPRFLVNQSALVEASKRLGNSKELLDLKGGEKLRDYFFAELVHQLDDAFSAAATKASPERPIEIGDKWIVGFNPNYEWKGHPGHYFVYSNTLWTKADGKKFDKKEGKKQAAELFPKCLAWLGALSSEEREKLEAELT